MRDVLEPARWWSWRRQRLDRSCRNVDDCLRSVVAIPATNPWGPLALLARVPRLTPGHAADATTSQVAFRTRAIRNTPMLVPFEAAPLALALGDLVPAVGRARGSGALQQMQKSILKLATEAPISRAEVPAALRRGNTNLDAQIEGLVARGLVTEVAPPSALYDRWSIVATNSWIDDDPIDPEVALQRFVIGYLTAFGPATIDDACSFLGVGIKRMRVAFSSLNTVDLGGGLMLLAGDARAFVGTRPHRNRVNLLPRGDAWLHAYEGPSLRRFGAPRAIDAAFDGRGTARPSILLEGEIVGTWDLVMRKTSATIAVDLVHRIEDRATAALRDELRLVAQFVEAAGLPTELEPLPKPRR